MLTFRDTIVAVAPRWLRGWLGSRILYALGIQLDAIGDAAADGVAARFPDEHRPDMLGPIGRERRIRRGPAELASTYATRLRRWLTDHRTRGGPYALLTQVGAYYSALPFPIVLRYFSGRTFIRNLDGTIVRQDTVWAPSGTSWARWWMYYDWPNAVTLDGNWGDPGDWGDGAVWGSSLTPDEVADIRLVPTEWNAAHCSGTIVLLHDGGDVWGGGGAWGPGEWGSGVVVPIAIP